MDRKKSHLITVTIILGIILVFSVGFLFGNGFFTNFNSGNNSGDDSNGGGNDIDFILPKTSSTFLDDEAGTAYYTNVSQTLNLVTAKAQFRTIEADEPDYVVGSLELSGLPETEDVHCFVHIDGWIVTYYLKAEPVGKIIDWNYYSAGTLSKTKLSIGLEDMCLALGVTPTYTNYYNFEFPNANKLKIIIEENIVSYSTDSFEIELTSAFTYYERSWAHAHLESYQYSRFSLNGVQISLINGIGFDYGELTPVQLTLDVFHTIDLYVYSNAEPACCAILLVYRDY